jgi:hypothetical protein
VAGAARCQQRFSYVSQRGGGLKQNFLGGGEARHHGRTQREVPRRATQEIGRGDPKAAGDVR